jgi:hypothetical protein
MSGPKQSDREPGGAPVEGQGVLANLPRTRPQRSSPRRAAAREAVATAAATARADSDGAPSASHEDAPARAPRRRAAANGAASARSAGNARKTSARPRRRPAAGETVPRQGFECEEERARGPVQPPGGAELVASAAEIVSELAKAGFSTGERLLKDVLSRLPLA